MTTPIILTGQFGAYRVIKGSVSLYVSDAHKAHPRMHFVTQFNAGDVFCDLPQSDLWRFTVKCSDDGDIAPAKDETPVFTRQDGLDAIEAIKARLESDIAQFENHFGRNQDVLRDAGKAFESINSRFEATVNADALVLAVQKLGKYLGTSIEVPTTDTLETDEAYLDTMLSLSNIISRPVTLSGQWHLRHSGALLAYLKDGTPVALTPIGVRSYMMYNPVTLESCRLTAAMAADILPAALSLMRAFPDQKMDFKAIMRFVFGEHMYTEIAIIALLTFLSTLVATLPPIISKQIFDELVPSRNTGMLFEVIAVLLAFQLANILFNILINMSFFRIKMKVDMSVQFALWHRLMHQSLAFFHRYPTGELISRVKGLGSATRAITLPLMQSLPTTLFSFVSIIMLYRYCAAITPYVLWLFVILFAVTYLVNARLYRINLKRVSLEDKATSLNHQFVSAMHRIKASHAENSIYGVWSRNSADIRALDSRFKLLSGLLEAFYTFFSLASVACVYLLIANQQGVGAGDFVAYIATFLTFQGVMLSFMRTLNMLPTILPGINRVAPILQSVPQTRQSRFMPKHLDGTIEMKHVSFHYDGASGQILSDISFRLEKGESLGIVGISGSGKSTLLKLLLGLYSPASGNVALGGYDLSRVDLTALRHQIGVVMQEAELTAGTLFQFIAQNDASLTREDIWQALEKFDLADDIRNMPKGLDTVLELDGDNLSHGQRQRLAIVRAVVKKRPYLFLDETTSHLDNVSQKLLMQAVYAQDATKIIIAQRLATVEKCDKLLILDQGRVAAFGSYKELVNDRHLYGITFDVDDD